MKWRNRISIGKWLNGFSIEKCRHLWASHLEHAVGTKLFLMIFCCIVLLVSFLGYFSYSRSKAIIQAKMSESGAQTIEQAADKLDLILDNLGYITGQLWNDGSFMKTAKTYLSLPGGAPEKLSLGIDLTDRLNTVADGSMGIVGAFLLPVDGSKPVSNLSEEIRPFHQEEWFRHVVQEDGALVWLKPKQMELTGKEQDEVFSVARLLKGGSSGKDFVFLMEIKLSVLDAALNRVKLGDGGKAVMLDNEGRIVYAADRSAVGQPFGVRLGQELYKNADSKGTTEIVGGDQLVAIKQVAASGWYAATVVPVSQLVKETRSILFMTLAMMLIAAAAAALVGIVIFRMVGRPLSSLRDTMREGERGNLTERVTFRSKDEIGQLGESFNRMMEQITELVQHTGEAAAGVYETSDRLVAVSKQTADAAKEIAAATEEIATGASSLAVSAERESDLVRQLSENVERSVQANAQMSETVAMIREGGQTGTSNMKELAAQTGRTEGIVRGMMDKVDGLKESASSIRSILELLNGIAHQTQVLALNATIEAARSGEEGRGFMVVAEEIRRLADESKNAIVEVGRFTHSITQEIGETTSALSEAYPVFQRQMVSVNETSAIFDRVQSMMDEFLIKLNEVSASMLGLDSIQEALMDTMDNVSAVSEESSATTEEVASLSCEQLRVSEGMVALAEQLAGLSVRLKESFGRFQI